MLALPTVHFCESCSYNAYPRTSAWCSPPPALLRELAELADKIADVATPTITATTTLPPSPQLLTKIRQLYIYAPRSENYRALSARSPTSPEDDPPDNPARLHTLLMAHPLLVLPETWRSCKEMQIPMLLHSTIKRPDWPLMATSASSLQTCRLLPITDRTNRFTFLVDTGAQVSVLPPTRTDCLRKREGFALSAVNGTAIATYGTRSLTLNLELGLRRTFCWIFVIADVHKPLLGADFLHHWSSC